MNHGHVDGESCPMCNAICDECGGNLRMMVHRDGTTILDCDGCTVVYTLRKLDGGAHP